MLRPSFNKETEAQRIKNLDQGHQKTAESGLKPGSPIQSPFLWSCPPKKMLLRYAFHHVLFSILNGKSQK